MVTATRRRALALLVPFAVYLAAVALIGDWIVDDAGISYAYARSVAHGHGFVSQPGRAPVEGFSDFLWVVLLVPFFLARVFHPVLLPKALGALGVLGSFALVQRALARETGVLWPGVLVSLLLAVSPPIVIWTASGLENGLLLLFATALYVTAVEQPRRWRAKCAVLVALLAMTHPEGPIFAAAGLALCLARPVLRRASLLAVAAAAGEYLGALALVYGPFLAFRLAVFGLPFPHPYYAKRLFLTASDRFHFFVDKPGALWTKLLDVASGALGPAGPWLLLAVAAAAVVLAARRKMPFTLGAALVLLVVALGGYLWMDEDWMGEYRFATIAVAMAILATVVAAHAALRALGRAPQRRFERAGFAACAVLAATSFAAFVPRIARFAENPPTAYGDVDRQVARKLDAYAGALGLAKGSVLVADLGATLMASRLTVYDAAGLCEPAVVHTLKHDTPYWRFDHPDFYDWVFETVRPTFIVTHRFWTYVTAFEKDPRFLRDYAAIDAYDDLYVRQVYGVSLHSGDFVRRDALGSVGLDRLRASYRPRPRPSPFVFRVEDALDVGGVPRPDATADELRAAALAARNVRHDPNRAAALFARLLEQAPGDLGARTEMAEALDAAGRTSEARVEWTDLLARARASGDAQAAAAAQDRLSDFGAADGKEDASNAWMQRGLDALYRRRAYDEAIAAFRQVLAADPTHYGATYQLATALEGAGRRNEARPLWARVLRMAEGYGDARTAEEARGHMGPSGDH